MTYQAINFGKKFALFDEQWEPRVVAEMTRTKKRSVDHLPVKLILVPGGFDFVVAPGSTARPSLQLASTPGSHPPHMGRPGPRRGRTGRG